MVSRGAVEETTRDVWVYVDGEVAGGVRWLDSVVSHRRWASVRVADSVVAVQ